MPAAKFGEKLRLRFGFSLMTNGSHQQHRQGFTPYWVKLYPT
jgi:hypothetical protein